MKKISNGMLINYVSYITNSWMIDNGEEQSSDINEYYAKTLQMEKDMSYRGDLESFRLGLDFYLCHPEINLSRYFDIYYGWEDNELRELFKYLRKTLYSELLPVNCDEIKKVEIVFMSATDWWDSRIELQPETYQVGWEKRTGKKVSSYNRISE